MLTHFGKTTRPLVQKEPGSSPTPPFGSRCPRAGLRRRWHLRRAPGDVAARVEHLDGWLAIRVNVEPDADLTLPVGQIEDVAQWSITGRAASRSEPNHRDAISCP